MSQSKVELVGMNPTHRNCSSSSRRISRWDPLWAKWARPGRANQNPAVQPQMGAQIRKNHNLTQQRLNQMDPKMIQQMGGERCGYANDAKCGASGAGGMDLEQAMHTMMSGISSGGGCGITGMMGGGGGRFPSMPASMDGHGKNDANFASNGTRRRRRRMTTTTISWDADMIKMVPIALHR